MAEAMSFRDSVRWAREVLTQWRHWTGTHWRLTLVLSTLAFFAGWAWNTYAMAVGLEGSEAPEGSRTTATADGHSLNAVYWLILFTMISAVVTYAWTRGWTAFRADVATFPRRFAEALASSRPGAFAMLLWGAGVALVIATLISSVVAIVLGLALLALASSPIGVILNFALVRFWRGLCGILAKQAGPRLDSMINPFMVMLGEGAGLLLDGMIDSWAVKLLLGVGCAVVSVALARGTPSPRAAMILAVAGAVVVTQAMRVRGAYADDGGWNECVTADGRPCADLGLGGVLAWLRSDGAGHVLIRGSIGAVFAALGALLGLGAGAAAASLARSIPDGGPRDDGGLHDASGPRDDGGLYDASGPRDDGPRHGAANGDHRRRTSFRSFPAVPPEPPGRPVPDPESRPDRRVPDPESRPDRPVPDPESRPDRPVPDPESRPNPWLGPPSGRDPQWPEHDPPHQAHPTPEAPRPHPGPEHHGTVYRSASAGHPAPEPLPHPPEPGPGASAGHGRGNPWKDLDDFLPDAPERNAPPRGRRAGRRDADSEDDGPPPRTDDDPDDRPRLPVPPRRP